MIKFESPYYLLLIFLILPFIIINIKNLNQFKNAYQNFPNSKKIITKIKLRNIFFIISWIFFCLSLACPLLGSKPISIRQKGKSIMIICDISKSMTANDILPNRITVEKEFLKIIIDQLRKSSFGLVIAKGNGILTVPISFEKNAINSAINSLSPHMLTSAGTNLEDAVTIALNSFSDNRNNSKIILLCTDGNETKGSLASIANNIKEQNATLIIVGFGTHEGSYISILNNEMENESKHTKLEESFLKKIASMSGKKSIYINACSFGAIENVMSKINSSNENIEKMIYIEEPVKRNFEMLLTSFVFLILGGIIFYAKNN